VFVEKRLAEASEIVFSAGSHTEAIRMPYAVFATAAHPVVGNYGELPVAMKSAEHDGRRLWV
jgi:hypothetical protein